MGVHFQFSFKYSAISVIIALNLSEIAKKSVSELIDTMYDLPASEIIFIPHSKASLSAFLAAFA